MAELIVPPGTNEAVEELKNQLQYVKCSSVEWEREDHRVTKEFLHATWIFAEKSQLLVVERKVHSKADRYRLLVPFRAFLGSRFNVSTDTLAIHVQRLPEVQMRITRKARGKAHKIPC